MLTSQIWTRSQGARSGEYGGWEPFQFRNFDGISGYGIIPSVYTGYGSDTERPGHHAHVVPGGHQLVDVVTIWRKHGSYDAYSP